MSREVELFTDAAYTQAKCDNRIFLAAVLMDEEGEVIPELKTLDLKAGSSTEAEYYGLLYGLECCVERGYRTIYARCDNEIVVKQMNGKCRVHKSSASNLYSLAKNYINSLKTNNTLAFFDLSYISGKRNPADKHTRDLKKRYLASLRDN